MPRIAIFLLCLPQKLKAMQSTATGTSLLVREVPGQRGGINECCNSLIYWVLRRWPLKSRLEGSCRHPFGPRLFNITHFIIMTWCTPSKISTHHWVRPRKSVSNRAPHLPCAWQLLTRPQCRRATQCLRTIFFHTISRLKFATSKCAIGLCIITVQKPCQWYIFFEHQRWRQVISNVSLVTARYFTYLSRMKIPAQRCAFKNIWKRQRKCSDLMLCNNSVHYLPKYITSFSVQTKVGFFPNEIAE